MGRAVTDYASELLPPEAYLSEEWHELRRETVSASEIATVLGISPWASPFDLWWSKRLGDTQPETEAMRRGRRLEPLILEDFADAHPEMALRPAGLCVNNDRTWQACTPDALAYESMAAEVHAHGHDGALRTYIEPVGEPIAVVEAKTAGSADGWGEQGTDDIPAHYRAQVLWQMDTLGLSTAFVPVWVGFAYREYVVQYDGTDVALMRSAALDFLDSLARDVQPDIDASPATASRLKRLHPSVIDGEAEVPATVVEQYHLAKRLRDAAQQRMQLAENRIRAAMGDHHLAVVDGVKVASRSVSEVRERTQTVAAHTRNTIRFSKPKGA